MDPPTETASEVLANPPADRIEALERRMARSEAVNSELRCRTDRIEYTLGQVAKLAMHLGRKIKDALNPTK